MLSIENNPWLGLAPYTINDKARFFGRDRELDEFSATIKDNYCTILYGVSGAGKTSMINAGLCPKLAQEGYLPITIRLVHNSTQSYSKQILEACDKALEDAECESEAGTNLSMEELSDEERLWLYFHSVTFWSATNHKITPVLFIDQFEELFTLTENETYIKQFFTQLDNLFRAVPSNALIGLLSDASSSSAMLSESEAYHLEISQEPSLRIVLSLREDFLPRLEDYCYDMPFLKKNRKGMRKMNGVQALSVIMDPEPGLVSRDVAVKILSRVTGQECPDKQSRLESLSIDTSILSLFCSELYLRAANEGLTTITNNLIDTSGEDILDSFYKRSMENLRRRGVRYLEQHLLTSSGFRNQIALEDINKNIIRPKDIEELEKSRIIRKEIVNGTERIEFTHDVLCKIALKHRDRKSKNININININNIVSNVLAVLVLFAGAIWLDLFIRRSFFLIHGNGIHHYLHGPIGGGWSALILNEVHFAIYPFLFCIAALPLCSSKYKSTKLSILLIIPTIAGIIMGIYGISQCTWHFDLWWASEATLLIPSIAVILSFFKGSAANLSIKEIFKATYKSTRLGENRLLNWGIDFVLLAGIVFIIHYSSRYLNDIAAIYSILLALPAYLLGRKLFFSKFLLTQSKEIKRTFVVSSLFLLSFLAASQYMHVRILTYFISLLLVINASVFEINYKLKSNKRIFFIPLRLMAVAGAIVVFVVLPGLSMGYNTYKIGSNARAWQKNTHNYGIKLVSKDGRYGAFKDGSYMTPVIFNDLKILGNAQPIQLIKDDNIYLSEFYVKDSINSKPYIWNPTEHIQESPYYKKKLEKLFNKYSYSTQLASVYLASCDTTDKESLKKYSADFFRSYLIEHLYDSNIANVKDKFYISDFYKQLYAYNNKKPNRLPSKIITILDNALKLPESGEITDDNRKAVSMAISDILSTKCVYSKEFIKDLSRLLQNDSEASGSKTTMLDLAQLELLSGDYKSAYRHADASLSLASDSDSTQAYTTRAYLYMLEADELSNNICTGDKGETQRELYSSVIIRTHSPYSAVKQKQEDPNYAYIADVLLNDIHKYSTILNLSKAQVDTIDSHFIGYRSNIDYVSQKPIEGSNVLLIADEKTTNGLKYYNARIRSGNNSSRLYEAVVHKEDDLYGVYFLNEKRGYLDFNTGTELTDAEFDHAWIFSEGLAVVQKGTLIGFIKEDGTYQLKPIIPCNTQPEDLLFRGGFLKFYNNNGKIGLLDKTGKWVVEPIYNDISKPINGFRILTLGDKTPKYGLIDSQNKIIFKPECTSITLDDKCIRVQETDDSETLVYRYTDL